MCCVEGIVDDRKSDVICAFVDECMEGVEDIPGDEENDV